MLHTYTQHKNARLTPLKRREMVELVKTKQLFSSYCRRQISSPQKHS